MINTKQIIAIAGVLLLMVVIFLQPVKSLTNEDDAADASAETGASEMFSLESVSEIAKQGLSANLSQTITDVEAKLKTASDDEKLALYKQLAELWDDVDKPMPAAYVYNEIALQEPSFDNWLKTGDKFTDSYQHLSDTVMAPVLTGKARSAYEKALEFDKENLDARTGLGTSLVNGPAPMEGITMLLGVVEEQPDHFRRFS